MTTELQTERDAGTEVAPPGGIRPQIKQPRVAEPRVAEPRRTPASTTGAGHGEGEDGVTPLSPPVSVAVNTAVSSSSGQSSLLTRSFGTMQTNLVFQCDNGVAA